MNVKDNRRKNLRALARALGGVTQLAARVGKSQSQISHLICNRPVKNIGDRVASHIEKAFGKPPGWLDLEHQSIQEMGNIYQTNSIVRHAYYQVPVISWEQAAAWLKEPYKFTAKSFRDSMIVSLPLNPRSFAVEVLTDTMESPNGGVSFPKGSTIIVDSEIKPNNGNYVIARMKPDGEIIFKQYIVDGSYQFLKPLNLRYPIVKMNDEMKILGVVRLMLLEFK